MIRIWCDGGASPNPGPGGWGVLIVASNKSPVEAYGGTMKATNKDTCNV